MTTFTITNSTSGQDLGQYQGETELDAYRAMMADAGYTTEEAAQSAGYTLSAIPDDIDVDEIEHTITIAVGAVRATTTEVEGGVDVDLVVTLDGEEIPAEALLVLDHQGDWTAYGDAPDYWLSGDLLARLRTLDDREYTATLRDIEATAAAAVGVAY